MRHLPPDGGYVPYSSGCRAGIVPDLARRHEERQRTAIGVGEGMQLGVQPALRAPDQAPRWSSDPPFRPQARRCAVRFQIGRINHDSLLLGAFGGQDLHYPGKDPHVALPLPSVVERLRRPILLGRITPPQAIAIDEDYATQDAPVIDPRLAMALRKERLQPLHLLVGQPEKVAHDRSHQFGA